MGITQRLAGLIQNAKSEERRVEIRRSGKKLIDLTGQGMGRVYRVLGITGGTGGQNKEIWPFVSLHCEGKGGEKGR
jgi:NADH dehydrogenase [ubiquinone] 1 alpha subcomplex assembly factor 7